jgi:hypothetical protein
LRGAWASVVVDTTSTTFQTPLTPTNLALRETFTGDTLKVDWDSETGESILEFWDGTLKYTDTVTATEYDLSATVARANGLDRDFDVRVYSIYNGKQSASYDSLSVSNPAPAVLSGLTVTSLLGNAKIDFTWPSDTDLAGVSVWASSTQGFTPSESNLVIDKSNDPVLSVPLTESQTTYLRIAAADVWGDDVNQSGEYSATGGGVDLSAVEADIAALEGKFPIATVDISDDAIKAPQIDANAILAEHITAGEISTAHIGALQITAGLIDANQINSGHMNIGTLSAISADIGTTTAGTLKTTSGTGLRTEISSDGTFPMWIGDGATKNEANGRFYVKTDGTLVIKDDNGNTIMSSGPSALTYAPAIANSDQDWGDVGGANKPADNAQVNAPSIGCRINTSTFSTFNTGEIYLHGFDDAGAPADIDGYVEYDGVMHSVTRREYASAYTVLTDQANRTGYIVFDTAKTDPFTTTSGAGNTAFAFREGGQWYYDNNGGITSFTPTDAMIAIGTISTSGADTVSSGTVWQSGMSLDVISETQNSDIRSAYNGSNLAIGATFTSSISVTNASYLDDGNKQITGSQYTQVGSGGQWLQADFGSVKYVAESRAYFYNADSGGGRHYDYAIAVSETNNNDWIFIAGTGTSAGAVSSYVDSRYIIDNHNASNTGIECPTIDGMHNFGRYVRLFMNGSNKNTGNHLYEWELWSAGGQQDPYVESLANRDGIKNSNTTPADIGYTGDLDADKTSSSPQSPSWLTSSVPWSGNKMTAANITTYMSGAAIDTAQIANAAITNALIDDAAITNAKIGSLAVDTLKIQNEAVSMPIGKITNTGLGLTSTWTNVQDVTLTNPDPNTSRPVFLTFSCMVNNAHSSLGRTAQFRFYKGTTNLMSTSAQIYVNAGNSKATFCFTLKDTIGAGSTQAYYMKQYGSTDLTSSVRTMFGTVLAK